MTRLLMTADTIGGVWQYATDLAAALRPHGVETVIAVMGPSAPPHPRHPGLEPGSRYLAPAKEEAGSRIKPVLSGVEGAGATEEGPISVDNAVRPEPVEGHDAGEPLRATCFDKLGTNGVEIIHANLPLDWLATAPEVLAAGDAIAALAREVNAGLIHLNSPALAARARFHVPVVAAAHGCLGTWWQAARGTAPDAAYAWHAGLMAAGLRAADAIVAPSTAFAATLQRTYALPHLPITVHNGRTPLPLPQAESSDTVFTAGRLWDEVKGADVLDQVAALIDVPFRAAGPSTGPHGEGTTLRHVAHLGSLDEPALAAELARRPIFVSAATFEPFGLAVLEAAQAGCPLVLSDIDTFRELWADAALFVPPRDPHAYAAAIARLRADPALRVRLGEAARLRAARYTPAAMAGAMAAIYARLLAEPGQMQMKRAAA